MAVYVSFSAEINPQTTEALIAVMADQVNKRADEVYLMISTPGGSVMNGLNLYNVLRGLPFRLITHNVGNVDSTEMQFSWLAQSAMHVHIALLCSME